MTTTKMNLIDTGSYYEFLITGNDHSVAEAFRYMQILCASLAFDDFYANWNKRLHFIKDKRSTIFSFSTTRRREVLATISCLQELSKEAPDLLVRFTHSLIEEYVGYDHYETQLFQLRKGVKKRLGYWTDTTIDTIEEAIALGNLSGGNPCFDDFNTAVGSIYRDTVDGDPIDIRAGSFFASAIVDACSKEKVRKRHGLMVKLTERLSDIENILCKMDFNEVASVYRELFSLYESLVLECGSNRQKSRIQPQMQTASIRI